jgi:hypothetical protein
MEAGKERHGRLWVWLDQRVGLADLEKLARKKEIPVHRHSLWSYLGGMTLFLFVVQVSTGILLLLYYRPSSEEAYESIQFLMAEVQFGWLIRSVHSWAANLMIFTLFVHLFSVLLLKAYRPPREVTWFSGMGLLGVALGFGFTGYLLPWNELSYFATKVGTEITGAVPLIGPFAGRLLRGGDEVTGATLTRFYGIHVAVLPATAGALLGLHLYLVQRHGMSLPPGVEREGGARRRMPFVPNFLLRDLVGWLRCWPSWPRWRVFPSRARPKAIRFSRARRYQAGVVFRVHVPDAQVPAALSSGIEAIVDPGFRLRWAVLAADQSSTGGRRGRPGHLFTWISVAIIVYMLRSRTSATPRAPRNRCGVR